jgi:uroporphyrinogen III methyltransferase/synthase
MKEKLPGGFVSLVGAGPGDRKLLTVKAAERIRMADVIVYDSLISPSILNEAKESAELIYVGKRSGMHAMTQEEINLLLVEKALQGKRTVRLKGGDPFIFGRGGEEELALRKNGISCEVIPGISSSSAVPAYAGIPVTHRDMSALFTVVTGHEKAGRRNPAVSYDALWKENGTLVFLMGRNNLKEIAERLVQAGARENTPVAVIQNGTTGRQRMCCGTLRNIAKKADADQIGTPAVIVIGKTVKLCEKLKWTEGGPLAGKTVLFTGTPSMNGKLEQAFSGTGAETVSISLIRTRERSEAVLKRAVSRAADSDWIVFTSGNGVNLFFDGMIRFGCDLRNLGKVRFAAVGSGSADALKARGFNCDFVPSVFTTEIMAKEFTPRLTKKDTVLLISAEESSPVLEKTLKAAGIKCSRTAIYETYADYRRRDELNRILPDTDYVIFASASAAGAFSEMTAGSERFTGKAVAIGPVTAKAAEKYGINIAFIPSVYTAEGIAEAILHEGKKKKNENIKK